MFFLALKDMSERTSRTIIQRRMQGTGVYRHYSEWTAKEQRATIQACGLASSKYTNKVKRNEILSHLVKVDLPADPGLVLRALRELNISILGASNRQQLAYLLLTHMSEGLSTPPQPTPAVELVRPSIDLLQEKSHSVLFDCIGTKTPWIYRHNANMRQLWTLRRRAWTTVMQSLNSDGGLTEFLQQLSTRYVKAFNTVMLYNPGKTPVKLRVLIDEEMFRVDENEAPKIFKSAWNEAIAHTYPEATLVGDVVMDEWRWAISHSIVAVRHAFSSSIRMQFSDDCNEQAGKHLPDDNEEDHAYYCAGVVWESMKKYFKKKDRIIKTITNGVLLDREQAAKEKLPTAEIASRWVYFDQCMSIVNLTVIVIIAIVSCMCRVFKELLYVNRAAFDHFKVLRDKYSHVTHRRGRVCVRDKMVLRRMTNTIKQDVSLRRAFDLIPVRGTFHAADRDIVFEKYVGRVETLLGNEVSRQLMELVKKSKSSSLESLRALKNKKRIESK